MYKPDAPASELSVNYKPDAPASELSQNRTHSLALRACNWLWLMCERALSNSALSNGERYPYPSMVITTMAIQDHEVYERIGTEGFTRLVAAFYKQVPSDSVLAPMYPIDDLLGAESRLRAFLIYRFGGPPTYIEQRGHPRLRLRHAPFPIDQAARDRWMQLMTKALEVANLPPEVHQHLNRFFSDMATFLVNRK